MPDKLSNDVELGFREIENNEFLFNPDGDSGRSIPELTDMEGVGPSTARKLKRAGIDRPSELYGLSQDQISAVDGIGAKTAAQIRRQALQVGNRDESDFTFRDDDVSDATAFHAERSPESRIADESFNAPVALDYDDWRENPSEFDFPGVDTIPRDRRLQRVRKKAARLEDAGVLDRVEATPSGPSGRGVTGRAGAGNVEVSTAYSNDPESTLAHELGHQADKLETGGRAGLTDKIFGGISGAASDEDTKKLREQGAELASRRRSISLKPEVIEEKAEKRDFAGGGFDEVFADAFAEAVEEPRRARKEAPDLVRAIEDETIMDVGRF